jgi:hypothetical protein
VDVDEDAAGGYELAYNEAVRALAEQRSSVEALRTRAGILLSAAAINSSLLGRQAFAGRLTAVGWLAVISFAALGISLLAILWPRREGDSTASPVRIVETRIETSDPSPLALIHRDLAYDLDLAYRENEAWHEHLASHFRRAALLLGLEVVALVADLASAA